jgi:hypothetical protein
VDTARRVYLTVAVVAGALLLALWLWPRVGRAVAPQPIAAYVGIEPSPGAPVAVGPLEIEAGQPFRLFAVLEARGRDEQPVYYTEATALRIGGRDVPAEQLRRWNEDWHARVLWFTVEPWTHYVALEPSQRLDRVRFQEFFHPDWPMEWVIEGRLDARSDEQVETTVDEDRTFGTQRFQVWVEMYEEEGALVPSARYRSWGMDDLEQHVDEFPTVSALLPGPAGVASAVFGLTAVDLPPNASEQLRQDLARRAEKRLLYESVGLLRKLLLSAGRELDALDWQRTELAAGPRWDSEVALGDLVRVGARWVIAYRDADGDGALGADDLCLDFEKGAAIRRLGEVFVGEGEIEWARLVT